jgi:nucleoporin NUP159
LSHVAFSADETVLVIAAENSGGLAAYKTETLVNEQSKSTLEISTNNQALLALVPNPNPRSAELFAAVTTNGELLIADLKAGQLQSGLNGPVLKNGVCCLSWSNMGKQLVAGLADGTVSQMTPDGTLKAEIPRPPALAEGKHVSSLLWLSNDSFLVIYSLSSNSEDRPEPSDYYIVSRQPKTQHYTFQVLPEVCPAFGLNRSPPCHFITRLQKFEPHIEQLLLLASTTSFELGVVTKSDVPLNQDATNSDSYTLTMPSDDSRRAQLPLSLNEGDTSPIGFALDLSARDSIVSPIPSDPEIEQSSGPLPYILALNHEGVLASWWIIYADAIRQNRTYAGLSAAERSDQAEIHNPPVPSLQSSASTSSDFGQPAFGQSAFGQSGFPAPQSFAKPPTSTFGSGSNTTLGDLRPASENKPSWTSTGFAGASQVGLLGSGQPAFGMSTSMKPAFGASTPFGVRPVFGQPATSTSSGTGSLFGQTSTPGTTDVSPFGALASATPSNGISGGSAQGFASFANKGGFSALASNEVGSGSPFGKAATEDSVFSNPDLTSPFAPEAGAASVGRDFAAPSTFKPVETSREEDMAEEGGAAGSIVFGAHISDTLSQSTMEAVPPQSHEEVMDSVGEAGPTSMPLAGEEGTKLQQPGQRPPTSLVTPPSTISQSKPTQSLPVAGLFDAADQQGTGTTSAQNKTPASSSQRPFSTTPKETPRPRSLETAGSHLNEDQVPKEKAESATGDSSQTARSVPEAPLPPDPTSKARYVPGDTTDASDDSRTSNVETPTGPVASAPEDDEGDAEASVIGPSDNGESDDSENEEADELDEVEEVEDESDGDFSSDFEAAAKTIPMRSVQ